MIKKYSNISELQEELKLLPSGSQVAGIEDALEMVVSVELSRLK